jgi:hypothetical protein
MDFENPGLKDWALRMVSRRCPGLSVKEMDKAAENLLQYMQVVWDIYKRLESEGRLEELVEALRRSEQSRRLSFMGHIASLLSYRARQIELQAKYDSKPRNR